MAGNEIAEPQTQAGRTADPPDLLFHRTVLLIAIGVLFGAMVLQIRDGQQVLLPVVKIPLPGTCTYKRLVGSDCPGCGLTRCFISLAHGELARAWDFNPAGILVFVVVILQLPYRTIQLWRTRHGFPEIRLRRFTNVVLWLMILGLVVQWIARTVLPQL